MTRHVEVQCSACGALFRVPSSLRGGLANCAHCGRAVQLPGGFDWQFAILVALGLLLVLLVAGAAYAGGGAYAGAIALGLGLAVLVGGILAS